MKTTIYELIGLIKNDKAPEKIKYDSGFWRYNDAAEDYYNDRNREYLLKKIFCGSCMTSFIDDEVEIIEEPKKIEKLNDKLGLFGDGNTQKIINELNYTRTIINELIDEINNLKEDD